MAVLSGCSLGSDVVVDVPPAGSGPTSAGGPARSAAPVAPGSSPASPSGSSAASSAHLVDVGYHGRYRAAATVLQDAHHGPQLCVGGVADSLPPQCGGPDLVGWSWKGLGAQKVGATTWGEYVVIGTYDGTRFTPTEAARPFDPMKDAGAAPEPASDDPTTPCAAPTGGWRPVEPAKATDAASQAGAELARRQDGFGGLWIDQNFPPGVQPNGSTESPAPGTAPNDPARIILNVSTTGDVEAMTTTVRRVWGGNLCVIKATHPHAELEQIMHSMGSTPGVLSAAVQEISGRVEVTVVRATIQAQQDLDRRYGAGVVHQIGRAHV